MRAATNENHTESTRSIVPGHALVMSSVSAVPSAAQANTAIVPVCVTPKEQVAPAEAKSPIPVLIVEDKTTSILFSLRFSDLLKVFMTCFVLYLSMRKV